MFGINSNRCENQATCAFYSFIQSKVPDMQLRPLTQQEQLMNQNQQQLKTMMVGLAGAFMDKLQEHRNSEGNKNGANTNNILDDMFDFIMEVDANDPEYVYIYLPQEDSSDEECFGEIRTESDTNNHNAHSYYSYFSNERLLDELGIDPVPFIQRRIYQRTRGPRARRHRRNRPRGRNFTSTVFTMRHQPNGEVVLEEDFPSDEINEYNNNNNNNNRPPYPEGDHIDEDEDEEEYPDYMFPPDARQGNPHEEEENVALSTPSRRRCNILLRQLRSRIYEKYATWKSAN